MQVWKEARFSMSGMFYSHAAHCAKWQSRGGAGWEQESLYSTESSNSAPDSHMNTALLNTNSIFLWY